MSKPDFLHPRWYSDRYWGKKRLAQAMREIIRRHLGGGPAGKPLDALVDLGCGSMPYRPLWEPLVGRYIGVDLPENRQADLLFEPGTGRVPLPDRSADVVLSTQVLEHVPSPEQYLAEARRVLKPQGLLVLSTHGFWMYHPSPTDYWRWTADGLKLLLGREGWEIVEFQGILGLAATALQLFQDAVTRRLPRGLRGPFVALMQAGIGLADFCSSREGRQQEACVYLVVARPARRD